MTHRVVRQLFAAAALALAGCVHRAPLVATSDPNVLTEQEIRDARAASIYDVIARLRPGYLRDRGPISISSSDRDVATVFLNAQEYGPIDILRNVPASDIAEVRYFSGIDAVTKFGRWYGTGVIQLISRDH